MRMGFFPSILMRLPKLPGPEGGSEVSLALQLCRIKMHNFPADVPLGHWETRDPGLAQGSCLRVLESQFPSQANPLTDANGSPSPALLSRVG